MSYELNVRCKDCSRFMQVKASSSSNVQIRCTDRSCKTWNTIKVVMLSDMAGVRSSTSVADIYKDQIKDLEAKIVEMDGRTKEAKKLNAQVEELKEYISQLEGIIDGQG